MNKKLILKELGVLEEATDAIPDTPTSGAIVKICYAGICHSDVHMYNDQGAIPPTVFPTVLGHEICGVIQSVGEEYSKQKDAFEVGTRVLAFSWGGCLQCSACKAGHNGVCTSKHGPQSGVFGVWVDGGFQHYLKVDDPWRLIKLDESFDMKQACLVPCSGITACNAVEACQANIERAIKIKGYANVINNSAGALSLWATEIWKAKYGDKIKLLVIDILEDKLKDAQEKGADLTLCLPREGAIPDKVMKIREKFGGEGADAIIDFVQTNDTQQILFGALGEGSVLVYIGLAGKTMAPLNTLMLIVRQITLKGVYAGTKQQVSQVLDLISAKKVSGPPVTLVSFDEIKKTLDNMASGASYRGRFVVELCKPE